MQTYPLQKKIKGLIWLHDIWLDLYAITPFDRTYFFQWSSLQLQEIFFDHGLQIIAESFLVFQYNNHESLIIRYSTNYMFLRVPLIPFYGLRKILIIYVGHMISSRVNQCHIRPFSLQVHLNCPHSSQYIHLDVQVLQPLIMHGLFE